MYNFNWYKQVGYSELLPHCNLEILNFFPSRVKKNIPYLSLRRTRQPFCTVKYGFAAYCSQSKALRMLQRNTRQFLFQGIYDQLGEIRVN